MYQRNRSIPSGLWFGMNSIYRSFLHILRFFEVISTYVPRIYKLTQRNLHPHSKRIYIFLKQLYVYSRWSTTIYSPHDTKHKSRSKRYGNTHMNAFGWNLKFMDLLIMRYQIPPPVNHSAELLDRFKMYKETPIQLR